jgi:hypothetical protein
MCVKVWFLGAGWKRGKKKREAGRLKKNPAHPTPPPSSTPPKTARAHAHTHTHTKKKTPSAQLYIFFRRVVLKYIFFNPKDRATPI